MYVCMYGMKISLCALKYLTYLDYNGFYKSNEVCILAT